MSDGSSEMYKYQCVFEDKAINKFGHLSRSELDNLWDKFSKENIQDKVLLRDLEEKIRLKESDLDMIYVVCRLKSKEK
jgi:hypothetical protein